MPVRGLAVANLQGLTVDLDELRLELLAALGCEERPEGPVLPRDEGVDLALPLHHQADGDGLHATRREAAPDLPRQQRAERVAHEPVDDPPRLLRVNEVRVDLAGVREGVLDRPLGDLGERHPPRLGLRDVGGLGHVPGDCLALAVEVGGEEDGIGRLRGLLDVGDLLAAIVGDDVLRREAVVDVDTELALARVLRQVADMAVRGQDSIVVTEVTLDRPGFGWGFHDDEVLWHGREYMHRSLTHRSSGGSPARTGGRGQARSGLADAAEEVLVDLQVLGLGRLVQRHQAGVPLLFGGRGRHLDELDHAHREDERRAREVDHHRALAVDAPDVRADDRDVRRLRLFEQVDRERLIAHEMQDGADHGGTIAR